MPLAIFDLDNTLLSGDSDYLWGLYLCEQGIVDRADYEAKNHQFYEDYRNGALDIQAFHRFSMQPLARHSMQDLLQWRSHFMSDKIHPLITRAALDLVNDHRQAGDTLMIITATNHFVTQPIAEYFGISHLIATMPEEMHGRFTGRVSGMPSFREGKVTRLQDWLAASHESLSNAYFYSDSHNDLPLLNLVDNPYAVDPDDQLQAHAQSAGWPIISLRNNAGTTA